MTSREDPVLRQSRRGAFAEVLMIVGGFLAVVAAVNPRGDFPLNDDWQFALATWAFEKTGHFQFSPYSAMSLRLQVLWGALWAHLFGHSYDVLRFSTLFLSVATLVLLNRFLLRVGVKRSMRFLAVCALLFHPVFFWSSFTYMTQVPYVFMSMLALYFYYRGFAEDRLDLVFAAAAAVVASILIRQTGIVNAAGPLLMIGLFREKVNSKWVRFGVVASLPVVAFGFMALFTGLLAASPAEFSNNMKMWREGTFHAGDAISLASYYAVFNFQNGGLFFLPLVLVFLIHVRRIGRSYYAVLALLLVPFLVRAHDLVAMGLPMPYWPRVMQSDMWQGNIFTNFGLGPPTLPDVWYWINQYPFVLWPGARVSLTYFSAFLGAAVLVAVFIAAAETPADPRRILLFLTGCLALVATAVLFVSGFYCDRYSLDSLWMLALLFPVLLTWSNHRVSAAAFICVLAVAIFSMGATAEYLSWNRARWEAFWWLQKSGIPIERIDGGYEINKSLLGGLKYRKFPNGKWFIDDQYRIAFGPTAGYETIRHYPFQGFGGLRKGSILVQRRGP